MIKIETYRGFEISFNPDEETFHFFSDKHDTESVKKSISASRKYIDDFIKTNVKFKPFWAERLPGRYNSAIPKIFITGIRKDGRFVFDKNGKPEQLSEYDVKDFILYNRENEQPRKEISDLRAKIDQLHAEIKLIEQKITGTPLIEYQKQLIEETGLNETK